MCPLLLAWFKDSRIELLNRHFWSSGIHEFIRHGRMFQQWLSDRLSIDKSSQRMISSSQQPTRTWGEEIEIMVACSSSLRTDSIDGMIVRCVCLSASRSKLWMRPSVVRINISMDLDLFSPCLTNQRLLSINVALMKWNIWITRQMFSDSCWRLVRLLQMRHSFEIDQVRFWISTH